MTETTDNPTPQDTTETGPVEATPTDPDLVGSESQQPAETESHATNDEPAATSDALPASGEPTEEVLDTEVHIAQI